VKWAPLSTHGETQGTSSSTRRDHAQQAGRISPRAAAPRICLRAAHRVERSPPGDALDRCWRGRQVRSCGSRVGATAGLNAANVAGSDPDCQRGGRWTAARWGHAPGREPPMTERAYSRICRRASALSRCADAERPSTHWAGNLESLALDTRKDTWRARACQRRLRRERLILHLQTRRSSRQERTSSLDRATCAGSGGCSRRRDA
jgi:hypothetical protein